MSAIALLTAILFQTKLPIPIDADLKKAESGIKATFEKELASKDRASRRAAGRKFLTQAAGASDPAERYVLLRAAVEMASTSLDIGTSMKASDELVAKYDVAPFSSHTNATTWAKKAVAVAEDAGMAADLCLLCWERAMSQGELDLATKWAGDALELAKKSTDTALKAAVDDIVHDTVDARKLQERATKAADASVDQGFYLIAVKSDWTKGIPFLAAADDPLGPVAKKDAALPSDPETKFEIGEGWAALASKEKNQLVKRAWELRSHYWMEDVYRSSIGLAKTRIAKKLLKGISIVKATSGKADVTTLVAEAIEKDPWTPLRTDITAAGGPLTIDYMLGGRRLSVSVKEGEVLVIPEISEKGVAGPSASRSFRIVAAHYGIANTFLDFSERAQKSLQDPFQVFSGALAGTDPFPGRTKHAVLQFEWHGRRFIRMVKDGEGIIPATGEKSRQ